MSVQGIMEWTVDIDKPAKPVHLGPIFEGDQDEFKVSLHLFQNGQPVSLTGATVTAYMRRADRTTVVWSGSVSSNIASVVLTQHAHTIPGRAQLVVRVTIGTTKHTVFSAEGDVIRTTTDAIVAPTGVIPFLDDLLAQIQRMEAGTAAAENVIGTFDNKYSGVVGDFLSICETTDNLIGESDFEPSSDAAVVTRNGSSVSVRKIKNSSYVSAQAVCDVSGIERVSLGCSVDGDGYNRVRIGVSDDGETITWLGWYVNHRDFDVSAAHYLHVGLYVSQSSNIPIGAVSTFRDIMICEGSEIKPYIFRYYARDLVARAGKCYAQDGEDITDWLEGQSGDVDLNGGSYVVSRRLLCGFKSLHNGTITFTLSGDAYGSLVFNKRAGIHIHDLNMTNPAAYAVTKDGEYSLYNCIEFFGSEDITIERVNVDRCYSAMRFSDCENVLVDSCRMENSVGFMVTFGIPDTLVSTDGCKEVVLRNNDIQFSGSEAIKISRYVDGITIIGNTLCKNARDGVDIAVNFGRNIIIANNNISYNTEHGIEVKVLSPDYITTTPPNLGLLCVQVSGNVLSRNKSTAISTRCNNQDTCIRDMHISGNCIYIDGNSGRGIQMANSARAESSITASGNKIVSTPDTKSTIYGIEVSNCSWTSVIGNDVTFYNGVPIALRDAENSGNVCVGNVVRSNVQDSIVVQSGSTIAERNTVMMVNE